MVLVRPLSPGPGGGHPAPQPQPLCSAACAHPPPSLCWGCSEPGAVWLSTGRSVLWAALPSQKRKRVRRGLTPENLMDKGDCKCTSFPCCGGSWVIQQTGILLSQGTAWLQCKLRGHPALGTGATLLCCGGGSFSDGSCQLLRAMCLHRSMGAQQTQHCLWP